jgi:adenosylcobinamide-GDP ribazoletransferase
MSFARQLAVAFMLLTRLPVGRLLTLSAPPSLARVVWAFPLVGLVVGGAGGLVYWLAFRLGMPPLVAAVWALAACALVTGALHEDGLADTADGFGGGAEPARKLAIMRDSRIGGYGALALIFSVLIKAGALAALAHPASVAVALIVSSMLGRGFMIVLLLTLNPAREDGMGASVGKPGMATIGAAIALTALAAGLLLPFASAAIVLALALVSAIGMAVLARRQIGGYTGDTLGACEQVIECVVLTALASTVV